MAKASRAKGRIEREIVNWYQDTGIAAEVGTTAGTIRIADKWTFRMVAAAPDSPLTPEQQELRGTNGIILHHRGKLHSMIVPTDAYQDMLAYILRAQEA